MAQSSIERLKSFLTQQARLARRSVRRFNQSRHYSLSGAPVLFANAFPKSGTHLLTQVLAGFAQFGPAVVSGLPAIVTYEGDTGRQRAEEEILQDLGRLLPGDIAYGHLHASPAVTEKLCQAGTAAYFMLRDPRDVVVSHVHYVTEMEPSHIHHAYYKNELKNMDERLRASIVGRDDLSGIPFPDIYARFEPYLGWLEAPQVMVLHFEDFLTQRKKTLGDILQHATMRGFTASCDSQTALQILDRSIDPERSPTFRRGMMGGWRTAFSPELKNLFKEVTGDLLIRLGYETGQNW